MSRPSHPDAIDRPHALADVLGEEVVLARPVIEIGPTGIRLEGSAWEAPGRRVVVVVSMGGSHVPLRGVVAQSGGGSMQIDFEQLSEEQKWALRKQLRDAGSPATT